MEEIEFEVIVRAIRNKWQTLRFDNFHMLYGFKVCHFYNNPLKKIEV